MYDLLGATLLGASKKKPEAKKPAAKPVAKPMAKPIVKKAIAKPVAKPVAKPMAKPIVKKAIAKPMAKPAVKAQIVKQAVAKATKPAVKVQLAKKIAVAPTKKDIGKLAVLDKGVNAGVKVYQGLKKPETKAVATQQYNAIAKQADAGNIEAKKAVGTIKQIATIEQQPQAQAQSDADYNKGAQEQARETINENYEGVREAAQEAQEEYLEEQEQEQEQEESDDSYQEESDDSYQEESDDSVEGDTMLGGLITMGFSFGDALKKAVSTVKKAAPTAMAVAKLTPYGSAVDTAIKAAGPGMAMGVKMLQAAKQGDKAAIAKVNEVQKLAASGSAQGKAALQTLQQAKQLNNVVVKQAQELGVATKPTASVTIPSVKSDGSVAPVQVFIVMPDSAAAANVVNAAKQSGSRFFLPISSSLYRDGLRN